MTYPAVSSVRGSLETASSTLGHVGVRRYNSIVVSMGGGQKAAENKKHATAPTCRIKSPIRPSTTTALSTCSPEVQEAPRPNCLEFFDPRASSQPHPLNHKPLPPACGRGGPGPLPHPPTGFSTLGASISSPFPHLKALLSPLPQLLREIFAWMLFLVMSDKGLSSAQLSPQLLTSPHDDTAKVFQRFCRSGFPLGDSLELETRGRVVEGSGICSHSLVGVAIVPRVGGIVANRTAGEMRNPSFCSSIPIILKKIFEESLLVRVELTLQSG